MSTLDGRPVRGSVAFKFFSTVGPACSFGGRPRRFGGLSASGVFLSGAGAEASLPPLSAAWMSERLITLPDGVGAATKSSKCNRRIKENFSRGFPAQAFSGAGIDQIDHFLKSLLRQCAEIIAFLVEEAQDIGRVFIGAALPWVVRLSKINGFLQCLPQQLKIRELRSIVQRDTQTSQLI